MRGGEERLRVESIRKVWIGNGGKGEQYWSIYIKKYIFLEQYLLLYIKKYWSSYLYLKKQGKAKKRVKYACRTVENEEGEIIGKRTKKLLRKPTSEISNPNFINHNYRLRMT